MNRRRGSRKPAGDNRSGRSFAFLLGAFVAVVALLQASLRFDSVRRVLNESIRLEGVPLARQVEGIDEPAYPWLDWPPADDPAPTGTLYVRLLCPAEDEVWVLVNGRAVKAITNDGGPVTVRDGDVVEVMSRSPVNVVVSGVSANVAAPSAGDYVRGEGALFLCRARLR